MLAYCVQGPAAIMCCYKWDVISWIPDSEAAIDKPFEKIICVISWYVWRARPLGPIPFRDKSSSIRFAYQRYDDQRKEYLDQLHNNVTISGTNEKTRRYGTFFLKRLTQLNNYSE